MKKANKIIISVIIAVLVISVVVLAGGSELFQGRFSKKPSPKLYLYKDKIVSVVTSRVTSRVSSPVSSVVVSRVTSPAGTSRVASVVTSPVASPIASPVASAVAADRKTAEKVDTKKLKTLTESILKLNEKEDYKKNSKKYDEEAKKDYEKNPGKYNEKAKEDYKNNPGKFILNKEAQQELIDLYKQNNPAQFNFEPAK